MNQPTEHQAGFAVVIQNQIGAYQPTWPTDAQMQTWCQNTLQHLQQDPCEVCLRLVKVEEIQTLNDLYRKKNTATNVLSFPSEVPDDIVVTDKPLGDVVLCPEIIEQEASLQGKTIVAHWAHLVIHGILHLLGYDHIMASEAQQMEQLEIKLLAQLGYQNPYEVKA